MPRWSQSLNVERQLTIHAEDPFVFLSHCNSTLRNCSVDSSRSDPPNALRVILFGYPWVRVTPIAINNEDSSLRSREKRKGLLSLVQIYFYDSECLERTGVQDVVQGLRASDRGNYGYFLYRDTVGCQDRLVRKYPWMNAEAQYCLSLCLWICLPRWKPTSIRTSFDNLH